MKSLKMDAPQCLLYSAAMILEVPVSDLIAEIGHDGMELIWPDVEGSEKYKGISFDEIIDCFISRGRALVPIWAYPHTTVENRPDLKNPVWSEKKAEKRFLNYLDKYDAILVGYTLQNEFHAIAYTSKNKKVCDPKYGITIDFDQSDFQIREAWIMI